jgi:ribosome maturation factor RimP
MTMDVERILATVEEHLGPILERQGLSLYDLELGRGKRKSVLRIFVDREGGISVDDCAHVSDVLSRVLDVEDPIPGAYDLEVSSPGLTRRLTKPRHFRGSAGHPVHMSLRRPVAGRQVLDGTLRGLGGEPGAEVVSVEVDGAVLSVPLPDVAAAHLVLPPDPGGSPVPRPGARDHRR